MTEDYSFMTKFLRYNITPDEWQVVSADTVFTLPAGVVLSFDIASGGHWYGHGFANRQPYPLEREDINFPKFAVNNIQAPVWIASVGVAILIETNQALSVHLDPIANLLSISCTADDVTVRLFADKDAPSAARRCLKHLGWPAPTPANNLLGDSIFCTWTQYPRCITQDKIIDMAKQIRDHGYPSSVLTIDDRWESGFGELQFSSDFPNPAGMIAELHQLGFQVLLWVTPFVNIGTANYDMLGEKGWLVPRKDGNGPATFTWWGGNAGLIDLTNPDGHAWFKAQLLRLRDDVGIDGFKIDGGDAKYQPNPAESAWYDCPGPSGYSDILLSLFEEIAPGMCETRTAWVSQRRNILWREGGKDSHWGIENGLSALVTLGLNLSVMGYDMLMPDMVPGRVQTMISNMPLPTDEFFVRWTEASAFFPLLQFSYFPWNYQGAAAESALEYAKIHKALESYLQSITANRTEPIMRPMWWTAPERLECLSCGDQWLLGPDLLVAPVLAPHQLIRDIILPGGTWIDVWTGKEYNESIIISHSAPCPGIPLFVRADNKELLESLQAAVKAMPYGKVKPGITTTTWESGLDRDIKVTG